MRTEISRRRTRRRGVTALVAMAVTLGLLTIPMLPSLWRYLRIERM